MNTLWKNKFKAFFIHLMFSLLLISSFMVLVTQYWYPDILFELENVWEGLKILLPVDATLGPLLTLIVFVPGKKGMKGDLLVIGILQILALVGGSFAIYESKPEVMVFAGDRFEIITSFNYDREHLEESYFDDNSKSYPFLVYALPGQTDVETSDFVVNNTQYQKLSERYRPLLQYKDTILPKALDLSKIKPKDKRSQNILNNFKERFQHDHYLLFILESTTMEARIIALDQQSLKLIGYLNLDPWIHYINTDS